MTIQSDEPGMDAVVAAYRQTCPGPPDLRLDDVGAVCPVDDTILIEELDGWSCPTCLAWWNQLGCSGLWLSGAGWFAAWVTEDVLGAPGLLPAAGGRPCHTCRTWVNAAHVAAGAAHW